MADCLTPGCTQPRWYRGLCRVHYHRVRGLSPIVLDEPPEPPWCTCEQPDWHGCGPLFPRVHECANCGKPDRNQLGTWPT